MPTRLLLALTAASVTLLPGCIVHVDHGDCCPPGVYAAETGNYAGAIRAANTVGHSSDRSATLATVAGKPDLDEPSQMMLVNSLRGSWGHSSDKTNVLQTLVSNPALTPRAALHVANSLERIASHSSDRKRIADLLASRPAVQPPTGHNAPQGH
ncbi:MAG TPA: hypothetical protein VFF65_09615 [Phycisphaerales bacterium]|nr:hypothetical protein [Phycisphaerales bacterium]